MAKSAPDKNHVGIYISPKEISIAQARLSKDGKLAADRLIKISTSFQAKEGLLRPLSLNNDFFNEKSAWVDALITSLKKAQWGSSGVIVTLSQQFSILRYFVMPLVDRRFWNKAIPIEAKKYIPVAFEEMVYDFDAYPIEGSRKLGILFGLTQRKTVDFIGKALESAGLKLEAMEVTACSTERLFSFLAPKDHSSNGYVHFSGGGSVMLFSSGGSPVLYRETDYEAASTMSERKRLDIKGAVQFVDRYVGGQAYKNLMLSGDGTEVWKPIAEHESPMPVLVWEPAKAAALPDNDAAAFFSMGASLRGRVQDKATLDISGISTASALEKRIQNHVFSVATVAGALLLAMSLMHQARVMVLDSRISALRAEVGDVTELDGMGAEAIKLRISRLQSNVRMLSILVTDTDVLAPKLHVIAETIPPELWLVNIHHTGPFAVSEMQSLSKELKLSGETSLVGEAKSVIVEGFNKALKGSREFFVFSPPNGSIAYELTGAAGDYGAMRADAHKATGFTIQCTVKRKK